MRDLHRELFLWRQTLTVRRRRQRLKWRLGAPHSVHSALLHNNTDTRLRLWWWHTVKKLAQKLVQVSCACLMHQIFVQVHASSCTRNFHNGKWKLSTTSTQQNENMAAIGSRPIRAHHSSHVHASFLYGIECCVLYSVQETCTRKMTRNHVRRSSFLYKFLDLLFPHF